jgi:hypothetical protein
MEELTLVTTHSTLSIADGAVSQFRQEYLSHQELLQVQPTLVQRYLETTAASLAEAVVKGNPEVHFSLPDQVACLPSSSGSLEVESVPADRRAQMAGDLLGRMTISACVLLPGASQVEGSPSQAGRSVRVCSGM